MKKVLGIILLMLGTLAIVGCQNDDVLNPPPAAPQAVFTITGDEAVYLYWNGPYEADLDEYVIYRSFEEVDNYTELARVEAETNSDLDLLIYEFVDDKVQNGVTYFYAVQSIDNSQQRSDLSAESAFDTPRPEGEVTLYPVATDAALSGFNFVNETVVNYQSNATDVILDYDPILEIHYLIVGNDQIDIQDMGFTDSFDDISIAPDEGWSSFVDMELIPGHTYVLWTDSENFAKMRPIQIFPGSKAVKFQWAYQTTVNNRELKLRPQEIASEDNNLEQSGDSQ